MARDESGFTFEITSGCLVKLMQTENICTRMCLYFQYGLVGILA